VLLIFVAKSVVIVMVYLYVILYQVLHM